VRLLSSNSIKSLARSAGLFLCPWGSGGIKIEKIKSVYVCVE
jgi:hypothetical protein